MIRFPKSVRLFLLASVVAVVACERPTDPDPVASVEINSDTAFVLINTTEQLAASARTADGSALSGVEFTWASSDTTVAAVSASGMVSARRYGRAFISATAGGVSSTATVLVTGTPGLQLVPGVTEDTISAMHRLVVEVRDARGLPLADVPVEFVAVLPHGEILSEMVLRTSTGYGYWVKVSTGEDGRASVHVRMGSSAGQGAISISAPGGQSVMARYVVGPGAPVRVSLAPADTALFSGRTLSLRPAVVDRGGNPTAGGAVTYSVLDGPLAVDDAGHVQTPVYGTSRIVARAAGLGADTARVASVPVGAFAAWTDAGLFTMNLDGTAGRLVHRRGAMPSWSPTGDRLVYALHDAVLTQGLSGPATVVHAGSSMWPRYSPDGEWIYFGVPASRHTIWRMRVDGTGEERVQTDASTSVGHASLSPDGTRMTFFAGGQYDTFIRTRNLVTGEESGSLGRGHAPSWSPMGDQILFSGVEDMHSISGPIKVMNSDGTERRTLTPVRYDFSARWSPDARWIIAIRERRIHLIEVATGLVIQLPFLEEVGSAAWKPGELLP